MGTWLLASVVLLFTVSSARLSSAAEWSGWRSTNDERIQYRVRILTFGAMSPNCEIEFRSRAEGKSLDFGFEIAYEHVGMYLPGLGCPRPAGVPTSASAMASTELVVR